MKLVVALGGHALAPGGRATLEQQRAAVARAAQEIAALALEHAVVVTHGNGPQIGWLANVARAAGEAVGFDTLGAESEGMLGYWLAQELHNALPGREVVALVTQVEVDPADPAFARPDKPIGPVVTASEAESLRALGLPCVPVREGFRRVVASPAPLRVLELRCIELLLGVGATVVCAGGGGIPVVREADGRIRGAPAVIDKDRSAELLATALAADGLLLLTDVPAVFADWPAQREPIRVASGAELARHSFERGSMAPKVEAACRFVRGGGRRAWIGALEDAGRIVRGEAGTEILGAPAPREVAPPARAAEVRP